MTTFKDFGKSAQPLTLAEALRAFKADLARPRPLRPQIILVRNAEEAAAITARLKGAK